MPEKEKFFHSVDLQLRFSDVDVLGHVNNTVYFSFFDTGKAYFFEKALHCKMEWRNVECVIANIDCAFVSPVYFGEEIEVWTRCTHIGEKSFVLQQMIVEKRTGELKAAANSVMVSIDPKTKKSVPVPPRYREAMTAALHAART